MKRLKAIRRSDFEVVLAEDWRPVVLEGNARPEFTRRIPQACIIASGQDLATAPPYRCPQLPDARLVGGIDAWRSVTDDPVPFNKDWYAVVASPSDPDYVFAVGPQRDLEHWSSEIPSRYDRIKVVIL